MPDQLDSLDRDLLVVLHKETTADRGREVCGLGWPDEHRSRVSNGSQLVRLDLCTAEMMVYCANWTRDREQSARLHRDPMPQSPHPHVRLTPAGVRAASEELERREAIDRKNAVRQAVLQWLTAHPQSQLRGAEPADFFSSRYADVAGTAVSREEFDQAVAWLQSGGFVTGKPPTPSAIRLITITHKGMICGEQYDGDVTRIPCGP